MGFDSPRNVIDHAAEEEFLKSIPDVNLIRFLD